MIMTIFRELHESSKEDRYFDQNMTLNELFLPLNIRNMNDNKQGVRCSGDFKVLIFRL